MSKTALSIGYTSTRFIADASRSFDLATEFIALIAQDHPAVFHQTVERVRNGETEPLPVELPALTAAPGTKFLIEQGGYSASLTEEEVKELSKIRGSQVEYAKRRLLAMDPHFADRNGADEHTAYYWVKELPNIKAWGC
jgi:hypothetical protein